MARRIPESLRTLFKTAGGRDVYDGDGIEPDLEIEPPVISEVSLSLISKYLLFDYANHYVSKHDKIPSIKDFQIGEAEYKDFMAFMKDKDYAYEMPTEKALKEFSEIAREDSCLEMLDAHIEAIKTQLAQLKKDDLIKNRAEISRLLREEIVSRYYYQAGRAEAELQDDITVNEAIAILLNPERYKAFLKK